MPARQEVLQALQTVPSANKRLSLRDFDLAENTPGERSVIASRQLDRPIRVRDGIPTDLHLTAYETVETDGTADNTETFGLSHDLVDADSIAEDLVIYEEGTGKVEPDSVDYGADTFDYTDDGTAETLHVYYVSGDQARIELRAKAPRNHQKSLMEIDAGLANLRDQGKDPLTVEFDRQFQGVIPSDWTLEIVVTAPYSIIWDHDSDDSVESNALIDVPIKRTTQDIPGLEDLVIQAMR